MFDLKQFLERAECENRRQIFSGFSGGADSTALLLALSYAMDNTPMKLEAIHFEHGIRGNESLDDADWCRKFCEIRKIKFRQIRLDAQINRENGETMESAARRLRLEAWQEIAAGNDAMVALGHHADDRIENLLIRLLRGSNCSGLSSLRPIQDIGKIRIIRPLLSYRRQQIEDYLHGRGISDWRSDSTNRKSDVRRNLLRNEILPILRRAIPETDSGLLAALDALDEDAGFLEKAAEEMLAAHRGKDALPIELLQNAPPALLPRILRTWLSEKTGKDCIPDRAFIQRLRQEINRDRGRSGEPIRIPIGDGPELEIRNGKIRCTPLPATAPPPVTWLWQQTKQQQWGNCEFRISEYEKGKLEHHNNDRNREFFDSEQMPESLTIRAWRQGDRMIPFGSNSSVKLKKIFTNAGINGDERLRYPVIAGPDNKIFWIAGIRRSNLATLKNDSKQTIEISFSGKPSSSTCK